MKVHHIFIAAFALFYFNNVECKMFFDTLLEIITINDTSNKKLPKIITHYAEWTREEIKEEHEYPIQVVINETLKPSSKTDETSRIASPDEELSPNSKTATANEALFNESTTIETLSASTGNSPLYTELTSGVSSLTVTPHSKSTDRVFKEVPPNGLKAQSLLSNLTEPISYVLPTNETRRNESTNEESIIRPMVDIEINSESTSKTPSSNITTSKTTLYESPNNILSLTGTSNESNVELSSSNLTTMIESETVMTTKPFDSILATNGALSNASTNEAPNVASRNESLLEISNFNLTAPRFFTMESPNINLTTTIGSNIDLATEPLESILTTNDAQYNESTIFANTTSKESNSNVAVTLAPYDKVTNETAIIVSTSKRVSQNDSTSDILSSQLSNITKTDVQPTTLPSIKLITREAHTHTHTTHTRHSHSLLNATRFVSRPNVQLHAETTTRLPRSNLTGIDVVPSVASSSGSYVNKILSKQSNQKTAIRNTRERHINHQFQALRSKSTPIEATQMKSISGKITTKIGKGLKEDPSSKSSEDYNEELSENSSGATSTSTESDSGLKSSEDYNEELSENSSEATSTSTESDKDSGLKSSKYLSEESSEVISKEPSEKSNEISRRDKLIMTRSQTEKPKRLYYKPIRNKLKQVSPMFGPYRE